MTHDDQDPVARPYVMPLPSFRQPADRPQIDDSEPMEIPETPSASEQGELPDPRLVVPAAGATRTATSSGGDARIVSGILSGILGMAIAAATIVVARSGRSLRQPTDSQMDGVTGPAARILARHADVSVLSPDLTDGVAIAGAVGGYLAAGPVIVAHPTVDYLPEDHPADPRPQDQPAAGPGSAPADAEPTVTYL